MAWLPTCGGISLLASFGRDLQKSTRNLCFIEATLSFVRCKTSASLVIRQHITSLGEADDALRLLLQLCAAHIEVLPLSSGRSGSVSGEVSAALL